MAQEPLPIQDYYAHLRDADIAVNLHESSLYILNVKNNGAMKSWRAFFYQPASVARRHFRGDSCQRKLSV